MKQMRMNDSTNEGLLRSDKNRASLKDIGGLRKKDFLGGYLERMTQDVKVLHQHVEARQAGLVPSFGNDTSQQFGVSASYATGIGGLNASMASNASLVNILPIL